MSSGGDTLVHIVKTDAEGRYRIENIRQGRYGVLAGPVWRPTFYPGTANGIEATLVDVTDRSTLDGLDFKIVPLLPTLFISGRVVVEDAVLSAGVLSEFTLQYSSSETLRMVETLPRTALSFTARTGEVAFFRGI